VTGEEFAALADRYAAGLASGDAAAAAGCFAEDVDYADPLRYRFARRDELLPFFEAPPGGHRVTWHRVLFDEAAQAGLLEYTYEGHHRYHGAAIAEVGPDGLIHRWREWQHVDDERDWPQLLGGSPARAPRTLRVGSIVWGVRDVSRAAEFWTRALDYRVRHAPDETWAILAPREGDGPQLALSLVTSGRARRHHLDLYAADRAAEVERLVALGARRVEWRYPEDADYVVLADPDGNPFCVVQA
jgi:catechol 2,3-dioxygenase-like lactoylglutathione lyase family enzyme